jgi:nitrate reductase gamma subunit
LEGWIEFGRGPLFRFAFVLMVLGLARLVVLTLVGVSEVWRHTPDSHMPWRDIARNTLGWLVPARRLWRRRPVYSTVSFVFHIGLLVVPLMLAAHVLLWKRAVGFAWPAIPYSLANWLTLTVILTGLLLALARALHPGSRSLSRAQDFAWPLLLVLPFLSGYLCSNAALSPQAYRGFLLVHIYAADLVLLLIPFTKIAHCVLAPFSQLVSAMSWKLTPGAGDRVEETLGFADRPTWIEGSRAAEPVRKEA